MKQSKMISHDPSEYIRGLQQLLVSDKKKVAFLFGAGTSLAKKNNVSPVIPAIGKMTKEIEEKLIKDADFKKAIEEIKEEISIEKYTIETLLSNLEQKKQIICKGTLNGLNAEGLERLIKTVKDHIRKIVSIHNEKLNLADIIHSDFAEWIGKFDRIYPIEIFTTNYDYLFELGLENNNIPYYDGFSGSYKPFFNAESVEDLSFLPNQTKLWKIHGSLGWHYDEQTRKVWRKDSDGEDILIYPSTLKYDNSRKQPYSALGDRLTNFLKQSDTILITCGYSFGDDHINERITTALKSNISAHIYVLNYDIEWADGKKSGYSFKDDTSLCKMAKQNNKISIYSSRNAVIGSQFGTWKLKREPDKEDAIQVDWYFDADGYTSLSEEIGVEKINEEQWTGEGELTIPDFSKFVKFLQSVISPPNL